MKVQLTNSTSKVLKIVGIALALVFIPGTIPAAMVYIAAKRLKKKT